MVALIAYDICSNSNRARLHRRVKDFGLNTQKSVFECEVDAQVLSTLRTLGHELVEESTDAFIIMVLCPSCHRSAQVQGQGMTLATLDYRII